MHRRDAALFAAYVGALAFCFVVLSSLGVLLVLAQRRRAVDEMDAPAPPRPRRTKITAS